MVSRFNKPARVFVDPSGNVFISDHAGASGNHVIRKVSTDGTLSTFAGTPGRRGFDGDGGPATSAKLHQPESMCLDASGNLYVADFANHRIRRIGTDGIISTFAGNGTAGFGGDGSLATLAALNGPFEIEFDSAGNMFIGEHYNNAIRKVGTDGFITTVVGTPGSSGYMYGNGIPATSALVKRVSGIAFDASDNLFFSDLDTHTIRVVGSDGVIWTVAGILGGHAGFYDGVAASAARLNQPSDIAFDTAKSNLYVLDSGNRRIRKVGFDGIISSVAGTGVGGYSGDGGPASAAQMNPVLGGLSLGTFNDILIADTSNLVVRKIVEPSAAPPPPPVPPPPPPLQPGKSTGGNMQCNA